ncbi:MAG: hypothetical protein FGM14_15385 [Flavobacteriales bacterium]|nr:hypothetical protein [Flavobacteriales bacterium]
MENLTENEKNRILVLVKTEIETLSNVVIEKKQTDNPKNYFNFEDSEINKDGDGVVPNKSSCHFAGEIATCLFYNRVFADDFKHPFFLKDNRVQKVINDFLKSTADTSNFDPREQIGRGITKA